MKQQFIDVDNIYMLWELIAEHKMIKCQKNVVKEQISNYIVSEISVFYDKVLNRYPNISFLELNKEYIKYIIMYTNEKYPMDENIKIQIHSESEVNAPITFQEIQEQRQVELNTKLNAKQHEFDSMVTAKIPDAPNFQDDITDAPTSKTEMDERIKALTNQRNYDLHHYVDSSNNYKNNDINDNINPDNNIEKNVSWKEFPNTTNIITDAIISNPSEENSITELNNKIKGMEKQIEYLLEKVNYLLTKNK